MTMNNGVMLPALLAFAMPRTATVAAGLLAGAAVDGVVTPVLGAVGHQG